MRNGLRPAERKRPFTPFPTSHSLPFAPILSGSAQPLTNRRKAKSGRTESGRAEKQRRKSGKAEKRKRPRRFIGPSEGAESKPKDGIPSGEAKADAEDPRMKIPVPAPRQRNRPQNGYPAKQKISSARGRGNGILPAGVLRCFLWILYWAVSCPVCKGPNAQEDEQDRLTAARMPSPPDFSK